MGLRIGLVTGEFPPMVGGVGAFTNELGKALADAGNQVHVITDRRARPSDPGRPMWDIREPYDLGFAQLHPRIGRWWWSALSVVADIATRYELQIVNLQYQALAYSMYIPAVNFLPWRLRGLSKTVTTFHDLRTPYLFPKAGPVRRWVVNQLARRSDGVIVTNAEDLATIEEHIGANTEVREIWIGSNIIPRPATEYEIGRAKDDLPLSDVSFLISYFGFISESKGGITLLEALARLGPQVHLLFIGGGTRSGGSPSDTAYGRVIERKIDELDLSKRVHFTGFVEPEQVSTYLQASEVVVMPYRDGASLRRGTLMAAITHGRPLVTTSPLGQVPQLVHGENVWFTPVDDPQALADAITELIQRPELRRRLATGAKALAKNFSWEKIAADTAKFYGDVIQGRSDG